MRTGFVIGDRGLGASGDTHPAWMLGYAESDSYFIVGASAIGQIHIAQKKSRDDAFIIRSVGSWLAVAVSDGVGSRPFSRYGATYVVESLTALALRKLVSLPKVEKQGTAVYSKSDTVEPSALTRLDDVELKDIAPTPVLQRLQLPLELPSFAISEEPINEQKSSSPNQQQIGTVGWLVPNISKSVQKEPELQGITAPNQFKVPGIDTQATDDNDSGSRKRDDASDDQNLVEILRYTFKSTHLGLHQHAGSLELELADLGCTALLLLLNMETGRLAIGQIGDGAVLGLTAKGKVQELVHAPDTGDPQSTYTINRLNFEKYLSINVLEPPEANPFVAFYVMSDGLSGDLLYSPNPVEPWALAVKANLQGAPGSDSAAAGMLHWLSTYQVKGSWDDRTLVVIMQREKSDGNRQPVTGQLESSESTDNSGSGIA